MAFSRSQIMVLGRDGTQRPWRWTTPPNADGTGGVKSAPLDGVFILLSPDLLDALAAKLTAAQEAELRQWLFFVTAREAAVWHVSVWAGEASAVYLRVPASIWNNPGAAPPAKVRNYLQHLWRQDPA